MKAELVIAQLFDACATALPYVERLFDKTVPPSPDYFALPPVIVRMQKAMDAAVLHTRELPDAKVNRQLQTMRGKDVERRSSRTGARGFSLRGVW